MVPKKKMTDEEKAFWNEQLLIHAPDLVDAAKRREAYNIVFRSGLKVLTGASAVIIAISVVYMALEEFIKQAASK